MSPLSDPWGSVDVSRPRAIPAAIRDVTINDEFWKALQEQTTTDTLRGQLEQMENRGYLAALTLTWKPGDWYTPHVFWESDLAKWIEAASYALATNWDDALDAEVDRVIDLLATAQQDDGYLNAYFSTVGEGRRFTDHQDAHELYCAGHLIEAGVAHYESTGKTRLLDIVRRYADLIDVQFSEAGPDAGGYDGHPEIELALLRLYRLSGEERYLSLAQRLVDNRGQDPKFFPLEIERRGDDGLFGHVFPGRTQHPEPYGPYNQSHLPVREQTEAVGHAVRAVYLYSGMTDLAVETGDARLLSSVEALWDDVTTRKMYVTASIGTDRRYEAFGEPYDLPNFDGYGETCASIGLANWAERLGNFSHDSQFFDVLELALYNGALSGKSVDGSTYFYENLMSSDGTIERKQWFDTSCCPPNLARFLTSLGRLVYSTDDDLVSVNLFMASELRATVGDSSVVVTQRTDYPRTAGVTLDVTVDRPTSFTLAVRVPEFVENLTVSGAEISRTDDGFLMFEGDWEGTRQIQLDFELPVERLHAHDAVVDARGKVAVRRGPIVYCAEEIDTARPTPTIALTADPITITDDSLSGQAELMATAVDDSGARLPIRLVPYFFWGNRDLGTMDVWLRDAAAANN